jgi:enoyl-CoA hydratase/carnithine racemase
MLIENNTFEFRDKIIELFDKFKDDNLIKVLIISSQHTDFSLKKFKKTWNSFFEKKDYEDSILRIFRIYDQILLKIKSLNKVVISMDSKCLNPMLFNFGMAADVRIISNDFYIDNDNTNMINIPKGGVVYSGDSIKTYINHVKLLFFSDKLISAELIGNNLVDKVVFSEDLKNKTLELAKRLENIDYSEIAAVKAMTPRRLRKLELVLQSENEFLMSCIRKRINPNTQEILRFH